MTNAILIATCERCGDSGLVRIVEALDNRYEPTGEYKVMPAYLTDMQIAKDYPYPKFAVAVMECPCRVTRRHQERIERLVAEGYINNDVRNFTFADFSAKAYAHPAGRLAMQLADGDVVTFEGEEKHGILICGNNGTGKTSMAYIVFRTRIERGQGAVWFNWNKLLEDIRWTYEPEYRGAPKNDLIAPALKAPFLVIDDLGDPTRNEKQLAGDAIEALRSIVEKRFNRHMPTIITTNLTTAQLDAQFGARDMSRAYGLCHVVKMDGVDMRKGTSPAGRGK